MKRRLKRFWLRPNSTLLASCQLAGNLGWPTSWQLASGWSKLLPTSCLHDPDQSLHVIFLTYSYICINKYNYVSCLSIHFSYLWRQLRQLFLVTKMEKTDFTPMSLSIDTHLGVSSTPTIRVWSLVCCCFLVYKLIYCNISYLLPVAGRLRLPSSSARTSWLWAEFSLAESCCLNPKL